MADEAALACPTCGQAVPEDFVLDKSGVHGPAGALKRWRPWNPPPAPGPEYLGQAPALDALEWEARATRTADASKDYICTGIGFNGYGNLVLHSRRNAGIVVADEHLAPLAALALSRKPAYGWRDIRGLLKLLRLAEERGTSDAEQAWLKDFAQRLVRYLPPQTEG